MLLSIRPAWGTPKAQLYPWQYNSLLIATVDQCSWISPAASDILVGHRYLEEANPKWNGRRKQSQQRQPFLYGICNRQVKDRMTQCIDCGTADQRARCSPRHSFNYEWPSGYLQRTRAAQSNGATEGEWIASKSSQGRHKLKFPWLTMLLAVLMDTMLALTNCGGGWLFGKFCGAGFDWIRTATQPLNRSQICPRGQHALPGWEIFI